MAPVLALAVAAMAPPPLGALEAAEKPRPADTPRPTESKLFSPGELELDLVPLLSHPSAKEAAAALEKGLFPTALAHARSALLGPLYSEERAAVRHIEASALASMGRGAEAFERFGDLARGGAPPELQEQAAWHHARLGIRLFGAGGAPDSVWSALEMVPLESSRGAEAYLHRSRRHLALGELDVACRLAREAADWREGFRSEAQGRLAKARCLDAGAAEARGQLSPREVRELFSAAAGAYREVAVRWPELEAGAAARERVERLAAAGIRPPPVDAGCVLLRARRISERRGPRTTTSALIRLRRLLGSNERYEIDLLMARVAKERRHFRSAARLYSRARRRASDPEIQAKGALGLEGLRARRRPSLGPAAYLALSKSRPGTAAAAEALARAGEGAWRLGRAAEATAAFERCLLSEPKPEIAARCKFGLAWAHFRGGRLDVAAQLLEPLAPTCERSRYWHARLLDLGGEHAEATRRLESLAASGSLSYYSQLAWSALGEVCLMSDEQPPPGDDRASHADVAAASALLRMGLASEAGALLRGLERDRLSAADRRLAARLLLSLGETGRAMRTAPVEWDAGLPAPPVGDHALDALLAYPRAFEHAVESESRHPLVPAPLLYALIRAESAFDPDARSHARALGLTQVIPPTAAATARRLGIEGFRFRMLTDPEVSVTVGSAYLGWLLERYDGNVALALAAYNAGETAVDRWLGRMGDLPLDAFLEEIPFAETNRYTRRVLTFWGIYRELYERPEGPPLDLRFDEPAAGRGPEAVALGP